MSTEVIFTMDEQQEAPTIQQVNGLSRDEHITRFLDLDARIRELSYERREHASALVEEALGERSGLKTVHLQANNGARIAVEFGTTWECNSEEIECAKELLKDEKFNELFKTTYTPRLRALKTFLNTGFSDERWETAKAIIKENVREVPKSPYVQAERKA